MSRIVGYMCGPRIYEYKGVLFEVNGYSGPWPLRKDGEPKARAGKKFYALYAEWETLPDRETYRVGGGCEPIVRREGGEGGEGADFSSV